MDHRRELPVRRLQRNLEQRVCYKKKNFQTDSNPLVIDLSIDTINQNLCSDSAPAHSEEGVRLLLLLLQSDNATLFGLLTSTGNGLQNEKDDDLRIHAMGVDSITTP